MRYSLAALWCLSDHNPYHLCLFNRVVVRSSGCGKVDKHRYNRFYPHIEGESIAGAPYMGANLKFL
jgi:hypothetical protein